MNHSNYRMFTFDCQMFSSFRIPWLQLTRLINGQQKDTLFGDSSVDKLFGDEL